MTRVAAHSAGGALGDLPRAAQKQALDLVFRAVITLYRHLGTVQKNTHGRCGIALKKR